MRRHLIHDTIKILYVREGYIPNIPYHLVSNEEMCNAFMNGTDDGNDFWSYNYPLVSPELQEQYEQLKTDIQWHLKDLLNHIHDTDYMMPGWVYSYMLGNAISVNSPQYDMHDMLVMLGVDDIEDEFTPIASKNCYLMSSQWLAKIPKDKLIHRPPTVFGEPHVLKALRLQQLAVNG